MAESYFPWDNKSDKSDNKSEESDATIRYSDLIPVQQELKFMQLEFVKEFLHKNKDKELDIALIKNFLDIGFDIQEIEIRLKEYGDYAPWQEAPIVLTRNINKIKIDQQASEKLLEKYNSRFWDENINPKDDRFIRKDVSAQIIPEAENFIPTNPDEALGLSNNIPKKKTKSSKPKKQSVEELKLVQEKKETEMINISKNIQNEEIEDDI